MFFENTDLTEASLYRHRSPLLVRATRYSVIELIVQCRFYELPRADGL